MSILVVEDNTDLQFILERCLAKAGANVTVAGSGTEAMSLALSEQFDAVLMDIRLPDIDGDEVTKQLRGKGYHTPIVAMTAHIGKELKQKVLDAGCNGYLNKPATVAQIVGALREHIPA
jgi:CheY-like chemotaxis protein